MNEIETLNLKCDCAIARLIAIKKANTKVINDRISKIAELKRKLIDRQICGGCGVSSAHRGVADIVSVSPDLMEQINNPTFGL